MCVTTKAVTIVESKDNNLQYCAIPEKILLIIYKRLRIIFFFIIYGKRIRKIHVYRFLDVYCCIFFLAIKFLGQFLIIYSK